MYRGVVRTAHLWVIGVSLIMLLLYALTGPVAGGLPTEGKWALLGLVILLVPLQGRNAVRNGTIKGHVLSGSGRNTHTDHSAAPFGWIRRGRGGRIEMASDPIFR